MTKTTQVLIFKDKCTNPYHVEIRINGRLGSNHYNIATYAQAVHIAVAEYRSRDMAGDGTCITLADYSENTRF